MGMSATPIREPYSEFVDACRIRRRELEAVARAQRVVDEWHWRHKECVPERGEKQT